MNMNTESAVSTATVNVLALVEAAITEAHAKDRSYCDRNFSLGSAYTHCARLERYLTVAGKAALKLRFISLSMASEYSMPYFSIKAEAQAALTAVPADKWAEAVAAVEAEIRRDYEYSLNQTAEFLKHEAEEVVAGRRVRVSRKTVQAPLGVTGVVTYSSDHSATIFVRVDADVVVGRRVKKTIKAGTLIRIFKSNVEVITPPTDYRALAAARIVEMEAKYAAEVAAQK